MALLFPDLRLPIFKHGKIYSETRAAPQQVTAEKIDKHTKGKIPLDDIRPRIGFHAQKIERDAADAAKQHGCAQNKLIINNRFTDVQARVLFANAQQLLYQQQLRKWREGEKEDNPVAAHKAIHLALGAEKVSIQDKKQGADAAQPKHNAMRLTGNRFDLREPKLHQPPIPHQ